MTELINTPANALKKLPVDPVARSIARPDACAKPATLGKVRVRVTQGGKSLKRKKKRNPLDKRDVTFY